MTALGMTKGLRPVVLSAACLIGASLAAAIPPTLASPSCDAHMHIQSPALSEQLMSIARAHPEVMAEMDAGVLAPRTGDDALRMLDQARIGDGLLLSEAYMWTSKLNPVPAAMAAAQTREEDAYNVKAAVESHGRLHAFIGINPLWSGALEEMRFWAGKPGVAGVKMHLANSGFDPRSATDVDRLALVLDEARKLRLPLVIHVRSAKIYSPPDAQVFIEQALPHVGDTPVQIAHSGGWGGLDRQTLDALKLYGDAIARHAPGTAKLRLDLALIVLDDHADPALAAEFAVLMRKIGLRRFVFGSDWPAKYTPARYQALLVSQIPLSTEEWNVVFSTKPTQN